jgi:hypothetical protein
LVLSSAETIVTVASTEAHWVALRALVPPDTAATGSHPIQFEIESLDSPGRLVEKSVFLIPR